MYGGGYSSYGGSGYGSYGGMGSYGSMGGLSRNISTLLSIQEEQLIAIIYKAKKEKSKILRKALVYPLLFRKNGVRRMVQDDGRT